MQIKGLVKTSIVDYPGKVATVVFVGGCDFRCPQHDSKRKVLWNGLFHRRASCELKTAGGSKGYYENFALQVHRRPLLSMSEETLFILSSSGNEAQELAPPQDYSQRGYP